MTSITRRGVEVPFRGGAVTATTFMDGYVVLAVTTHGASFSLADGQCIAGPCRGESLRAVEVSVVDGEIVLGDPAAGAAAPVRTAD